MSDSNGSRAWRFIVVGLLMMGTLGFSLAGLCGAAFTAIGMTDVFKGEAGQNYAAAFLIISVPSLLIGGGLAFWCGFLLARRWRDND